MLFQTCGTCVRALSFTWGSWLNVPAQKRMWRPFFHAARAETPVWIFQSLWNCWQRALLLCGSFSASLKQGSARPPRAERHLKICEGDLKGRGGAWRGDSLLVWQRSGGPVRPELHDNYRARTRLGKTACRRNTSNWAHRFNMACTDSGRESNLKFKTTIRLKKLYHNQCLKLQRVVFLPADTQQVFSRYFLYSSLVVNSWKSLICLHLAFRLFSAYSSIFFWKFYLVWMFHWTFNIYFSTSQFHWTVNTWQLNSILTQLTDLIPGSIPKLIWKQHTKLKC